MNKLFLLTISAIILNGCASKEGNVTSQNDLPDPVTDYPYDVVPMDSTDTSGDVAPIDPANDPDMNDHVADDGASGGTIDYKVKAGDSLWRIANEHNTTVAKLKQLNNLPSDKIKIGQTLQVPQ